MPGAGLYIECPDGAVCVHNRNSKSLSGRLHVVIFEVSNSESANSGITTPDDITRLESYQAELKAFIDHVGNTQHIDQPHSFPYVWVMPVLEGTVEYTANAQLNDILDMYVVWYTSVVNSESARISNGWVTWDMNRYLKFWDQINAYIETVLKVVNPSDKPQSAHIRQTTPGGPKLNAPTSPLIGTIPAQ